MAAAAYPPLLLILPVAAVALAMLRPAQRRHTAGSIL